MSSDTTIEEPDLEPIATGELPPGQRIAKKPFKRFVLGQTAVDFWGRRRIWLAISGVLIVLRIISLSPRALNLGIDFEGGVAYDVPAGQVSPDDMRSVLDEQGLQGSEAKVEQRRHHQGDDRRPARGRTGGGAGSARRTRRRRSGRCQRGVGVVELG